MTGERLAWYRVASHLHSPVAELKARITYSEFLDWLQYLRWQEQRQDKIDFYLAQIAAEVRRGYVRHPKSVKMKDFIITYLNEDDQHRLERSKKAWLSLLKISPN